MSNLKIFVFDGINFVPVARQFCEALNELQTCVMYVDPRTFPIKSFYRIRRAWLRKINKIFSRGYSVCSRLSKHSEKRLRNQILKFKPDILLVVGLSWVLVPEGFLRSLKEQLNCRLILFDTESGNFLCHEKFVHYLSHEINQYDQVVSFSKTMTEYFQSLNIPVTYFPFGFTKQLDVSQECPMQYDICFIGSPNFRRLFILEKLKKYNLVVYGKGWKKFKPFMSQELIKKTIFKSIGGGELIQALKTSKIVLNITNEDFFGIYSGINLRPFEAIAYECFMLTDYSDELAALFDVGQEIATYNSYNDLIEKVDYYLANDELRLRVAKQGHLKYLSRCTWIHRARDFLSIIKN
ncbi:MAG: glycosyltransferase [Gammaproteobacteria bacterium]|nr:glycosyltransferase [Gammaproteobacteria bacterium]MBU1926269.1 glycosyltransferase [Gammaproteobacteria bacterium]MBU2546197.1 glycosyltransferase [Gammaproteobacteria bacterium]